jgi:molecular chaperone DnaJ
MGPGFRRGDARAMTETDYYEVLQVERTADANTLRAAYRKLAMECHPDRNGGCTKAEAKFKALSEAYECLKDPQKRAAYDRFGHAAFKGQSGFGGNGGAQDFGSFADIFDNLDEFFGQFMGRGQPGGTRRNGLRGSDLQVRLEVRLEDAYHGRSYEIEVDTAGPCKPCGGSGMTAESKRSRCGLCGGQGQVRVRQGPFSMAQPCPDCRGLGEVVSDPCPRCRGEGRVEEKQTVRVDIPAGVDEGSKFRVPGKGEAGVRGGPPGDLYIFVHLARHPIFQREGTTLFARCPVSFTVAALGGCIEVPGLDKQCHEIKIPAGIQSGKQLRQRGAGMPSMNGRGHGDMVIQVEVETPTKLTAKQREILEQFRDSETGEECPNSKGFFQKLKTAIGG